MNLYILSLREGCLEAVFSIPEATYEKYFPLTLDRSRALENLTYEPVGLKFKSIYYSDTWSVKSDEQDASFTDTEGQVIIRDPNDTKTDIHVSIPVNHTDNGQTNKNTTKSDNTLCTPDISNGANKHELVPEDDNDEDNDPFANTGTNLYNIISEQNDTYTELEHIVPQPGRKMHRISVRETANEKPFVLHSPPYNKEKQ
uniref:Uncharacterized protein n=1 Tax=Amphimedon queenslandica TaxID=400682 RepID=A0A1X7TW62_AMPQE